MKFQAFIAIFASIVATSLGMDQPSFHTKGTPTGKPTGPLKPGEYWWKAGLSPRGPVVVLVSLPQQTMHVYRNGNPIGRAALEVKGRRLGEHVFTLLEGVTGKPSQLAPGRQAGRWMRVDGAGNSVTAEKLTSRLQFSPEFAHKVANEIAPGTTVIVTDARDWAYHLHCLAVAWQQSCQRTDREFRSHNYSGNDPKQSSQP